MMMENLRQYKARYAQDRSFRPKLYKAAALATAVNVLTLMVYASVPSLGIVLFAVTVAASFLLYYVCGGAATFIAILLAFVKLISGIAGAFAALTFFMMGVGGLFAWLIGIVVGFYVVLIGLGIAWLVPILMIPFLTFLQDRGF